MTRTTTPPTPQLRPQNTSRGRTPTFFHYSSRTLLSWGGTIILFIILTKAAHNTEVSPSNLFTGAGRIVDIIYRAIPPDWSQLPSEWGPTRETIDTALIGTALGALMAGPLALLSARTIILNPIIRLLSRSVVALLRAVPDLVWALIFVTAVGLGPFPGVLSLTLHTAGMLGRLGAEMIEDMDTMPLEAMELTGANRLQIFVHVVVPTLIPSMFSLVLYRLDENLRCSLVLGFVGAGGLGFQLFTAISLFQYRTASLLLLMILIIILIVEISSSFIRKNLL